MNCFERLASLCVWNDERSRARDFVSRGGDDGGKGDVAELFTSANPVRGEMLTGQPIGLPSEDLAEARPPSSDGGGVGTPLENSYLVDISSKILQKNPPSFLLFKRDQNMGTDAAYEGRSIFWPRDDRWKRLLHNETWFHRRILHQLFLHSAS